MTWAARIVVFGLAAGLAGCSRSVTVSDVPAQQVALQEVGELIRATTQPGGRRPSKVSDFDSLRSQFPNGYQAVKSGDVVVLWGAGVAGEGEAAKGGGDVIAYEKDAPTQGGYVLLTSGEVKKMSASEFQSAPKAK
jgi:hypothetical protein